jgi:hypothetical protein
MTKRFSWWMSTPSTTETPKASATAFIAAGTSLFLCPGRTTRSSSSEAHAAAASTSPPLPLGGGAGPEALPHTAVCATVAMYPSMCTPKSLHARGQGMRTRGAAASVRSSMRS